MERREEPLADSCIRRFLNNMMWSCDSYHEINSRPSSFRWFLLPCLILDFSSVRSIIEVYYVIELGFGHRSLLTLCNIYCAVDLLWVIRPLHLMISGSEEASVDSRWRSSPGMLKVGLLSSGFLYLGPVLSSHVEWYNSRIVISINLIILI